MWLRCTYWLLLIKRSVFHLHNVFSLWSPHVRQILFCYSGLESCTFNFRMFTSTSLAFYKQIVHGTECFKSNRYVFFFPLMSYRLIYWAPQCHVWNDYFSCWKGRSVKGWGGRSRDRHSWCWNCDVESDVWDGFDRPTCPRMPPFTVTVDLMSAFPVPYIVSAISAASCSGIKRHRLPMMMMMMMMSISQ